MQVGKYGSKLLDGTDHTILSKGIECVFDVQLYKHVIRGHVMEKTTRCMCSSLATKRNPTAKLQKCKVTTNRMNDPATNTLSNNTTQSLANCNRANSSILLQEWNQTGTKKYGLKEIRSVSISNMTCKRCKGRKNNNNNDDDDDNKIIIIIIIIII